MHINITHEGVITVHGSRRLAARLHGQLDGNVNREALVERLVLTGLIAPADRYRLYRMVRRFQPSTIEGWQATVAAVYSDDDTVTAAVTAVTAVTAVKQRVYTLDLPVEQQEQEQYVYVYNV